MDTFVAWVDILIESGPAGVTIYCTPYYTVCVKLP